MVLSVFTNAKISCAQAWAEAADPALRGEHLAELLPADEAAASSSSAAGGARRMLYRPHLAAPALARGLRERTLFQGTLRVNRECVTEARVAVSRGSLELPCASCQV